MTTHSCSIDGLAIVAVVVVGSASTIGIEKWAATQKAEFNLSFWAMSPKVKSEPKGTVLIIAPFNGPIVMCISPLVRIRSLCAEPPSAGWS